MKKLSLDERTMEQARRMIVAITGVVVLVALGFTLRPVVISRVQQEAARQSGEQSAQDVDEGQTYAAAAESIAT